MSNRLILGTFRESFNIFMEGNDKDKSKLLRVGYGKLKGTSEQIKVTLTKFPSWRGELHVILVRNKHDLIKYGVIPYSVRSYNKVDTPLNRVISTGCLVLLGVLNKEDMIELDI